MKKLLAVIGILFFCTPATAQKLITAKPADNAYKFVWSKDSAVFKMTDGSATIRCRYVMGKDGVDNDAVPYTSHIFTCENGNMLALKQANDTKETILILTDGNGNKITSDEVSIVTKK